MDLIEGQGGPDHDRTDNYVVYVMDSDRFPFFQGEDYHQFHENVVLRRPVPDSYLIDLRAAQRERLKVTSCPD